LASSIGNTLRLWLQAVSKGMATD